MRSGIGGQSSWICIRQHGGEAEDDDDVRDIGKHDFRSDLLRPMLSNADHLLVGAMRPTKKQRTCF